MKLTLIGLATILLFSPLCIAGSTHEPPLFLFSGTISVDGQAAQPYEIHVPAGVVRHIDLADGIRLEFSTPLEDGVEATTHTKVLRKEANGYQILKRIQTIGFANWERSWSFAVCDDVASSASPASPVSCQLQQSGS